ncbi:MAG: hypothetical protein RL662_302 [Bacteroidota bacterium]|jgi:shikimate kinase
MTRIFLIGYMGVGKTTIGRDLAQSLNFEFIDLDHFIQIRYNKTIAQLFEDDGEAKFRKIESNLLKEVASFERVVISTGGGTPCFFDNMAIMNNSGITIYLKADAAVLAKRLNRCKEKRPLIKDKDENELLSFVSENLDKRRSFYNQAQIVSETTELVNKEDITQYIKQITLEIQLFQNS